MLKKNNHILKAQNKKQKVCSGFTLIEVMIAVALFTIIMTIGIGAVLNSNTNHKKTETVRAVMDNLSFVMEDMSRNLRLGSAYHCGDLTVNIEEPLDCQLAPTIAFEGMTGVTGNASDQIVYGITSDGHAIKSTDSGATSKNLTPSEVSIDPLRSGFSVVGSSTYVSGDRTQPRVIIRLAGTVTYRDLSSDFDIQTTVSQRLIDL